MTRTLPARVGAVHVTPRSRQRYECVRLDRYLRKRDGKAVEAPVWRSDCAICGAMFEQITTRDPKRTCPTHRGMLSKRQGSARKAARVDAASTPAQEAHNPPAVTYTAGNAMFSPPGGEAVARGMDSGERVHERAKPATAPRMFYGR